MTDTDKAVLRTIWDEEHFRDVLERFFLHLGSGAIDDIRAAVNANDIVRAAIAEGKLKAFESLPQELNGVTRIGTS